MPSNTDSKILPPMMNDRGRPPRSRAILGILVALLCVAVLLTLWSLVFNRDDSSSSASGQSASPTPLTLATSTPAPATTPTAVPTAEPAVAPTPLAVGFEQCADAGMPLVTSTYIVDTNTTPLNQRAEPSVDAEQTGTFSPGQDELVFTGDVCREYCRRFHLGWKIFNGTNDVWVASKFVSAN